MPLTIDTCVWACAFTPNDVCYVRARHLIKQVFAGEHRVIMPFTGLTETVCKVSNILKGHGKNSDKAIEFGDFLLVDVNITWIPIDREFAYSAAMFGRLHRLRGMDALYAFTALKFDCELLTADNDFFKSANTVIKVRHLGEFK